MKLSSSADKKQEAAPSQMKTDGAAAKSMAPPPFELGAGPSQMKKLDEEKEPSVSEISQVREEEEKKKETKL